MEGELAVYGKTFCLGVVDKCYPSEAVCHLGCHIAERYGKHRVLLKELGGAVLDVRVGPGQMYAFFLGSAVVVLEFYLKEVVAGVNIGADADLLPCEASVVVVQIHCVEPVIKILGGVLRLEDAVYGLYHILVTGQLKKP